MKTVLREVPCKDAGQRWRRAAEGIIRFDPFSRVPGSSPDDGWTNQDIGNVIRNSEPAYNRCTAMSVQRHHISGKLLAPSPRKLCYIPFARLSHEGSHVVGGARRL